VLGFEEQMRNDNEAKKDALGRTERSSHKENRHGKGTLGALKVRDLATGVRFDIGTGFTDAERQAIWDNQDEWFGAEVKYKSQPVGVKDKPRFPVFLGRRVDL
jgi:DNA ligase-1